MGLTRYWYRPPSLDSDAFSAWSADCRAILDKASMPAGFRSGESHSLRANVSVTLRGPDGHGEPVVTDSSIALNGDASVGQEYEPFQVERVARQTGHRSDESGRLFEYCKTNGKPYDAVVDACLIAFERRFGSAVKVEADAAARALDAGKQLYAAAVGNS